MAFPVMPQRPTQREFLVVESSVEVRVWQDQRTLDLVPPLASGDQLGHLGSSYETQYKQESAICEMGFNGDLAQQQFWEAHVRFGSKADVTLLNFDVRFTPESGHSLRQSECPFWANSGRGNRADGCLFSGVKRTPQIGLFIPEDAIDIARGLSRREQSCCWCHAQCQRVPTTESRTSGTSNGQSLLRSFRNRVRSG